jgi:hypothetical protein
MKKYFIALTLFFIFSACSNDQKTNAGQIKEDEPKKKLSQTEQKYFEDVIIQTIEGFTSSIEVAAIISDLKMPYSQKYLVPTDAVKEFDTNFKKALGLGMLSVDLGYLNVYRKISSNVVYLSAIRDLADDLDIDSYFDFATLKRLATRDESMDSLMFLSVSSYHKMNKHLMETERSHLSALVVTGVWLEGLYLVCEVNKFENDARLRRRIAEQMPILETILNILIFYENKTHFRSLVEELILLKQLYEQIQVVEKKGDEKKIVNEDGIPVIDQGGETEYVMSDDLLKKISMSVSEIRNKKLQGIK